MRVSITATSYITVLPVTFITWWFLESPKLIFKILTFIFAFVAHQLGYKSLFKTFFKPWKNEYREGLVRFSIFMGMVIKSLLIVIDTVILLVLLISEVFIIVIWVLLPFIVLWGMYASFFA